ncbi:MAG: hypothetical protein KDK70_29195, partial [Myxococcales bacterium]|nr:hypothetical protein [Myxococcales bacterium]
AGDFSVPLHVRVILSELWSREPGDVPLAEVSTGCLFCPADRAALGRMRPRWPTYPAPTTVETTQTAKAAPRYRGPLWMLQGGLDPGVTPAMAARLEQRYRGAHQHFVAFPTGAHTLTGKTPAPKADCALAMLHAFVEDPTQAPPECAAAVPGPRFALGTTRLTEALMGDGDPWAD